jgi:hypothetical protein
MALDLDPTHLPTLLRHIIAIDSADRDKRRTLLDQERDQLTEAPRAPKLRR